MMGSSETTDQQAGRSNSQWRSARLLIELSFKSLLIGTSIAALMFVMGFTLLEIFLVSTTAILAAMIMAISEYDAIAADRDGPR